MDKDWLNNQIALMVGKRYTQDMSPQERVKGGISAIPVIGDAISGYDAYQLAKQGKYTEAALNAVGLLPYIPSLGMVTKSHIDDIMQAINKEGKKGGSYGLRVIPGGDNTPEIGDLLGHSYKWVDRNQTSKVLRGSSTVGLPSIDESSIRSAFDILGIGNNLGKHRPYYYGDDVVLVKGTNRGKGVDKGERLISGARVVWRGKKKSRGFSDLEE